MSTWPHRRVAALGLGAAELRSPGPPLPDARTGTDPGGAPAGRPGAPAGGPAVDRRTAARRAGAPPGGLPATRRPWARRASARGDGVDVRRFLAAVGEVTAAQRAGASPADAWRRSGIRTEGGVPVAADLLRLCPDSSYVAAVTAGARLATEVGAPTAALLERVAMAVGRDAEAAAQRRASLAGPRATARVLGWLPAVGLVLGALLGADPVAVLLDGGRGTALLLAGLGLLAVGRWWSAAEVRAAVRAGEDEG